MKNAIKGSMKTLRLLWLAVMMALACGKDASGPGPVPPPPPSPIVQLLVADADTGFWFGDSLSLSDLIVGAVNADGDTVAAPSSIAWSLSAGFVRNGNQVTAMREARGTFVASVNNGYVTTSIASASLDDLSARGVWSADYRCYDAPDAMRGYENPPIGIDSMLGRVFNGELTYSDAHWGAGNFLAWLAVDEQVIVFWKNGVIDTALNRGAIVARQDTLSLSLGSNYPTEATMMRRVSNSPLIYRRDPPGVCQSDWRGGGTAFQLRAAP